MGPLPCPWVGCSNDWLLSQFLFHIEMKPLPVQPVPITLCLFHVALCEERASDLLVDTLQVLWYCDEVPLSPLSSREKRPNSFSLWSSLWPFFGPSLGCLHLFLLGPELYCRSVKCWVEWDNCSSVSANNAFFAAVNMRISPITCKESRLLPSSMCQSGGAFFRIWTLKRFFPLVSSSAWTISVLSVCPQIWCVRDFSHACCFLLDSGICPNLS